MNIIEARQKAKIPSAFSLNDLYIVLNTATGEPLESHPTLARAAQAAGWCNDHEVKCGRAGVYDVEKVTP